MPQYFREDLFRYLGAGRPDWQWLIVGPAKSGSSFHKVTRAASTSGGGGGSSISSSSILRRSASFTIKQESLEDSLPCDTPVMQAGHELVWCAAAALDSLADRHGLVVTSCGAVDCRTPTARRPGMHACAAPRSGCCGRRGGRARRPPACTPPKTAWMLCRPTPSRQALHQAQRRWPCGSRCLARRCRHTHASRRLFDESPGFFIVVWRCCHGSLAMEPGCMQEANNYWTRDCTCHN